MRGISLAAGHKPFGNRPVEKVRLFGAWRVARDALCAGAGGPNEPDPPSGRGSFRVGPSEQIGQFSVV
jgi:hypothetical protein